VRSLKKWICIAVILLSGRSLLPAFDISASLKLGLAYPFYSGRDYLDYLMALDTIDWLTDPGYPVDWRSRIDGKGIGFNAGISLTLGLTDFFALLPEIFLSRYGGCYGFDDSGGYGKVIQVDRLRTIETMLLAAFRFGRRGSRWRVFAGPAVAFRRGEVGIKIYQEGHLVAEGSWSDTDFTRLFLNAVAGTGITWYLRGRLLLSLEARYTRSLTALMNETVTGITDWNQNAVQLLVGIGKVLAGKGFVRRSNLR
jgi:hypothetical protein